MSKIIEQMLKNYRIDNIYDRKNAMKEILQEIILCGLSRAGFFKQAAFYGGTALNTAGGGIREFWLRQNSPLQS